MLEGVYQNFAYPSHVNTPSQAHAQGHPQGHPQAQPSAAPASPSSPTLVYTPETHLQHPVRQHPSMPSQQHHPFGGYRDAYNYRGYYPAYSPAANHHTPTAPSAASVYADHSHYNKTAETAAGQYPSTWSVRPPPGGGYSSWTSSPPSRPLAAGVNYIGGPGAQPVSTAGDHGLFEPGHSAPVMSRPKLTTTVWEDENTVCYQVDAKGVCVARRADNSMINGTKLLNVVGMSRGKRDGILKSEKGRVVVKVGAMHLKGVWIPMKRAQTLATKFGILDLLYPLFEQDLSRFAYTMPPPRPVDQMREVGFDKRLRPSTWNQAMPDQGPSHPTPIPTIHTTSTVGPRPSETESDDANDTASPTSPTGTHTSNGTHMSFYPGNNSYVGLNYYYHQYDYGNNTANGAPRPLSPFQKVHEGEKRKRQDEPINSGDHVDNSSFACSPVLMDQPAKRASLSSEEHPAPYYARNSASYSPGNTAVTPSLSSNDRDKRVH